MRYLDLCEAARDSGHAFVYYTNCTDTGAGRYLEAMMDQAKQISYTKFMRMVDQDSVKETFPEYRWGPGTDLTMRGDGYVTYYQSTFRGLPCYYVQHSGIEHIFLRRNDFEAAHQPPRPKGRDLFVQGDGSVSKTAIGTHVRRTARTLEITFSSFPSAAAARTLLQMVQRAGDLTIVADDEETDVGELTDYLQRAIDQ